MEPTVTSEPSDETQRDDIQRPNDELERILNISLSVPQIESSADSRYCWVCFATDEEDQEAGSGVVEWIKPCNCKGTLRWVATIVF